MKHLILIFTLLVTYCIPALAGFKAFNGTTDLKVFQGVKCDTGITCTRENKGILNMVSSPSLVTALTLTAADATDAIINMNADNSDDNGDDWQLSSEAAANLFSFSNNTSGSQVDVLTISPLGDVVLAGTTPSITIGDAGAEDTNLLFDGNAQDYNVSLDDTTDDLVIGLGLVAGTTDALRIDENQDVTVVQDLLPLSTITGDGGAAVVGMLQNLVVSTTTTLTLAQCGSTIVSNSADVVTLPEASTATSAAGNCRYTFVCGTADDFDVNPFDATDVIGITGSITGANTTTVLAPAAGDALRCTDIGAGFVLEAVGADLWTVISTNGIITDVN